MKFNNKQQGNVLFLILIAVALFAALSYAVTQSSRSGGDSSRETNILNAAQLTQYPTSIRTAVLRLVIDGYQDTGILFNLPSAIVQGSIAEPTEVFATIGGGAVFQNAPAEMMDANGGNLVGRWFFNMDFEVPQLGRSVTGDIAGNELIAFLPGITASVCTRINLEAGIINNPTAANPTFGSDVTGTADGDVSKNITAPASYVATQSTSFPADLTGRPFGCFRTGAGNAINVMYTVILER